MERKYQQPLLESAEEAQAPTVIGSNQLNQVLHFSDDTQSADETAFEVRSSIGQQHGPQLPMVAELLQQLASKQEQLEATQRQLAMSRFGLERYGTDKEKLYFSQGSRVRPIKFWLLF